MGACATKPKVLKAADDSAHAPPPEPALEEDAAAVSQSQTKLENGNDGKTEEIDDKELDSKSPSLSHLFDQNEGKGTDENKKTAAEETAPETEKQIQPPEDNPPEPAVHSDLLIEKITILDAVDTNQDKVVVTEKIIETPPKDNITSEPKKEYDEAVEEKIKAEVTVTKDPPEKTESSEKATETEPALVGAQTEGGSVQDRKEKEVKVSNEGKVGV